MLRHVALFTWKLDASDASIGALSEGLAILSTQIPEIRAYRFGVDVGLADGNDDFVIVADFDDLDAYRRYAEHPAHRRLIAELVAPIVAGRHAVQYEV